MLPRPPAAGLLALLLATPLAALPLGWEDFSYPNGPIAGRSGGTGFHYDLFDGTPTATTSDWDNVQGTPAVSGNALATNNSSAKREFNGPIEGAGGPSNDGQDNHERSGAVRGTGQVFFRVRLTRSSSAVWSGVSSYDFGAERLFFGVPGTGAATDTIGIGEDGVGTTLGTLTLNDTQAYDLLAVIDFDNNLTGLFVDPDSSDSWDASGGSADVTRSYFGTNWSTAVRLGSGGQATWDKLRVVTDWSDLALVDDDTDNDGMSDAWEDDNDLVVGVDDGGLDPDGDGLNNRDEFDAGTDPQERDSDGDGFGDGSEVIAGASPLKATSIPGATPPADLVGIEDFGYPDGPVSALNGGFYWDFDNSTLEDKFLGHTTGSSSWANVAGAPQVGGGRLLTRNSSALRTYGVPLESAGAIGNAGHLDQQVVYYRFTMTRRTGASWGGASSYELGAERFLFGVPNAPNPGSGQREFAIHDLPTNTHAYSGIQPIEDQTYTLVARLDYATNQALLYLNPDLSLPEPSSSPVASYNHGGTHASTAIRFGSGGSGDTEWDEVRVATSWEALTDTPPDATADSCPMALGATARIPVLQNDTGSVHSPSLTILSAPGSGTATANPDGTITYQHTTGTPATDTLTYQVTNLDGSLADTATVTISFSTAPRFDTAYAELPSSPPATAIQIVDAFPGLTFDSPHDFCTVPGDPGKLFVTEGDGRVFLIPDVADPSPVKLEILDLTDRINHDDNELALKGIAAHPDWATNGYLYVTYNASGGTVRLSRFTCQTTPPHTAGSELILIDQTNADAFHNISTCAFGSDGYLYVGFGDEGTQEDAFDNSQHIDKDLWSCLIRIDVDKKPGGHEPNPDPDIPRDGGGLAHFSVPPDNPFVGATSFNGVTIDPGQVRTEIFLTGLRNPWQFSPEDHDDDGTVDEIWVGDVGRSAREEIGVYTAGQNGGWAWREGSLTGIRSGELINGAPEAAATLTPPLWDYAHGGGAFEGQSVTGGLIYRSSSLPGLTGKYIFADYVSGNIWSLDHSGPSPVVERLGGEVAIVALTTDPSNGDLLLLDRGNTGFNQGVGSIKRLNLGSGGGDFPQTLSQTNFFTDPVTLEPNPGGIAYQLNLRFWSDFAEKSRWFLLNDTTDTVGYSRDHPWDYPEGMVWVKHFDYPTQWESFSRVIDGDVWTDRRPLPGSPRRRLETRFLVRTASGAYGVSYRWNNITGGSQIDAALADNNGEQFEVDITVDGTPATVPWEIPSRSSCLTCHTPEAGHALSFNTRQLNTPGELGGSTGNFLSLLSSAGYATGIPADPSSLPRHLRPDETTYSLEARVRSYLDVNCAYCHQADGTGGGSWDGRSHLTLADTGLVNGSPSDAPLHPADLLVVPANVDRSILYNRAAAANGYSRMPPLATEVLDLEGAQLLADWIRDEVQPHASYDSWRIAHFGNATSAEGEPDANPDADSGDNRFEWLTNTDPNDAASLWQPDMRIGAGDLAFAFPGLGNRAMTVWTSPDLQAWSPWAVPGNDGLPLNPAETHSLEGPRSDPDAFFRFTIEER